MLENIPAPTNGNVFFDIDKDENKQLTREEMKTFLTDQDSGSVPKKDDKASQDAFISEIFEQEDLDQDGAISYEEYSHEEL